MKVLELFKGTGSITKYYQDTDVEVISLDILKKYDPTLCMDIMDFEYKKYKVGEFDIIWASPECKIFSMLQNTWVGRKWETMEDLNKARQHNACFINRTLEIIEYLKPKLYFLENPLNSKIWDYIDKTKWNNFVTVDYCRFGTVYKKPTKILTNKILNDVRCNRKGKHDFRIGIGQGKLCKGSRFADKTDLDERYGVPQELLKYLIEKDGQN